MDWMRLLFPLEFAPQKTVSGFNVSSPVSVSSWFMTLVVEILLKFETDHVLSTLISLCQSRALTGLFYHVFPFFAKPVLWETGFQPSSTS
jgi:hypothetical protein